MSAGRDTVLYDDDCGFCKWTLAVLLARDRERRLRPVPLQAPEADRLLAGMDHATRMASWHLVTADGTVRSAGAAAGPLLRRLPGLTPVAAVLERFPGVTARSYRWVAEHRTPLSKPVPQAWKRRAAARIAAHG